MRRTPTFQSCHQCGAAPSRSFLLLVSRGDRSREWQIRVCQDCWRVFEAMLDGAMEHRQLGLVDAGSAARVATFLW